MLAICCIERLGIKLPVHVVTERHVRVLFECYFVTKMVLAVLTPYIRLFDIKKIVQNMCNDFRKAPVLYLTQMLMPKWLKMMRQCWSCLFMLKVDNSGNTGGNKVLRVVSLVIKAGVEMLKCASSVLSIRRNVIFTELSFN